MRGRQDQACSFMISDRPGSIVGVNYLERHVVYKSAYIGGVRTFAHNVTMILREESQEAGRNERGESALAEKETSL